MLVFHFFELCPWKSTDCSSRPLNWEILVLSWKPNHTTLLSAGCLSIEENIALSSWCGSSFRGPDLRANNTNYAHCDPSIRRYQVHSNIGIRIWYVFHPIVRITSMQSVHTVTVWNRTTAVHHDEFVRGRREWYCAKLAIWQAPRHDPS